jgi:Xaa-Pro dipeptidase
LKKYLLAAFLSVWAAWVEAQDPFDGVITRAEALDELATKRQRLTQFLTERNLDGLLLTRTANFSWATAGLADNHILITSELGAASLLLLRDGQTYLVGPKTELAHLLDEDFSGLNVQPLGYDWFAGDPRPDLLARTFPNQRIGTDAALGTLPLVDIAPLRYELTPSEVKKYRWVCQQSAEAVAAVCRAIQPGQTDREIETLTSNELMRHGLRPTVLLIGVDERLERYYHYPPIGKKLEKHAFVNVCARRWGLVSSVGRYVHFGSVPAELQREMRHSAEISARQEAASKPGTRAADIARQVRGWYAERGYPEGHKTIHFGGGIGYAEREWVATETGTEAIRANQALAWNPFARAALSFDTILVHPDGTTEKLTELPGWPTIPVTVEGRTYRMPGILVR